MYCEILSNTIHCSTHLVSCSYISCKVTVSHIDSMYSLVSHRLMAYCHFFFLNNHGISVALKLYHR